MGKKLSSAYKSSGKNVQTRLHKHAPKHVRGIARMLKERAYILAPTVTEVQVGVGYRIGVVPYVDPSPTAITVKVIGSSRESNMQFKIGTFKRGELGPAVVQYKVESQKMKKAAAAIHDLYVEEHEEIEAFTKYIPAHLSEK